MVSLAFRHRERTTSPIQWAASADTSRILSVLDRPSSLKKLETTALVRPGAAHTNRPLP
jgi:hypothetical protein